MDIDHYLAFLEQVLTPKRLAHSLGVMGVMEELSEIYSLDRECAMVAGLLHDAAKDLEPAQQRAIVEEGKIEIRHVCENDWSYYLHGPAGAYFVHRELGITEPLILDAISTHTFYGVGKNFDAPLCWCLRFSDILEPTRDWSKVKLLSRGAERLRRVVYEGRLDEGALLQTGWLVEWYTEDGKAVHPDMRRVYRELSVRLRAIPEFLDGG